ncbi:MAG: helix-turn-helix domain-containing protein [Candidatus Acidiferrales bacterium]
MDDKLAKLERGALARFEATGEKIELKYARLTDDLRDLKQALTVEEVAALLQVSERHVYSLVQTGAMPHFKVGNAVRFDPDSLADWLQGLMKGNPPRKKTADPQ